MPYLWHTFKPHYHFLHHKRVNGWDASCYDVGFPAIHFEVAIVQRAQIICVHQAIFVNGHTLWQEFIVQAKGLLFTQFYLALFHLWTPYEIKVDRSTFLKLFFLNPYWHYSILKQSESMPRKGKGFAFFSTNHIQQIRKCAYISFPYTNKVSVFIRHICITTNAYTGNG